MSITVSVFITIVVIVIIIIFIVIIIIIISSSSSSSIIQSFFCSWFTTIQLPGLYPKPEATGSDIFYLLLLLFLVFGFSFCPNFFDMKVLRILMKL